MMMAVRFRLRRAAWIKWLPPMAVASPSPMTTITWSLGLASLTPVAKVKARPWVVWSVLKSTYTLIRPAQPIPVTRTMSSLANPVRSIALISAPRTMPLPHPGHQTWGNFFSWRRYLWISLVTSDMVAPQLSAVSFELLAFGGAGLRARRPYVG